MFVCFNCGDGFKTYDCFLKHSCDAEASSFEINFKKEEENISDQVKIESYQRENTTVNNQLGGYIKCPFLKCKNLYPKDEFMVPIALREHIVKSHKNEEDSELFQKIVNQTPSTLNCEICGKSFSKKIFDSRKSF